MQYHFVSLFTSYTSKNNFAISNKDLYTKEKSFVEAMAIRWGKYYLSSTKV